jgi:hypothetical protein
MHRPDTVHFLIIIKKNYKNKRKDDEEKVFGWMN